MNVHCLISPYRKTNNYLVEISPKKFIGIDIGNINLDLVHDIIGVNNGALLAYFITHAHADHALGLKGLYSNYDIPIFCSDMCAIELGDAKRNFSYYSDDITTFEYKFPYVLLKDEAIVTLEHVQIHCHHVPGHSPGCMAYGIGDILFTGDFLMKHYKTPLNFPNSSKLNYKTSLSKISSRYCCKSIQCYSGHGDTFLLHDQLQHFSLPSLCK